MQIQRLDCAAAQKLYTAHMVRDFPAAELKPFTAVRELMQAGLYEPLALCGADGGMRAYAWQVLQPGRRSALLDYFAVRQDLRGAGVGTQALRLLAERYRERLDSLILECEHPDEAPDRAAAERRIAFYLRAGARQTAFESRVFGVRYRILALPCGGCAADEALGRDLRELYRLMVPEPYCRGHVIFYGPGGHTTP